MKKLIKGLLLTLFTILLFTSYIGIVASPLLASMLLNLYVGLTPLWYLLNLAYIPMFIMIFVFSFGGDR